MIPLLLQVQRLKIDTEAAMLELDQILHANELSIALVAAVPSMLLLGKVSVLQPGRWEVYQHSMMLCLCSWTICIGENWKGHLGLASLLFVYLHTARTWQLQMASETATSQPLSHAVQQSMLHTVINYPS